MQLIKLHHILSILYIKNISDSLYLVTNLCTTRSVGIELLTWIHIQALPLMPRNRGVGSFHDDGCFFESHGVVSFN